MKINKNYYGNCLTLALRAKVSDWKHTHIIYLSPENTDSGGWPHFLWYCDLDNNVYDFNPVKHQNTTWEVLWCKGYIKARPYEVFKAWEDKFQKEKYNV